MYDISKIWSNLFWFGPAIAMSNFDEVQKISKFKIFWGKIFELYQKWISPKKFLNFEIFWTSSKFDVAKKFQNSLFFRGKFLIYTNNVWNSQNLEYTFLILASNCPVKFWRSQKNLFFLSPQFRYFLNVWNIKNLEYTFLIWAGNCRVKFWRSPKNFKKINLLGSAILCHSIITTLMKIVSRIT